MPKRSAAHMKQRRRQILSAAWSCFEQEGLEAATMKRIGECAGLSIGALYTHFNNKQELLVDLLAERDKGRNEKVITSFNDLRTYLGGAAEELSGVQERGPYHLNIQIIQSSFTDDGVREAVAESTETSRALFYRTLRALQEAGEIRPDYDIASGANLLTWVSIGALLGNFLSPTVDRKAIQAVFDAELDRMTPEGA